MTGNDFTMPFEGVATEMRERIAELEAAIHEYVDRCPMCRFGAKCEDEYCAMFRKALAAAGKEQP